MPFPPLPPSSFGPVIDPLLEGSLPPLDAGLPMESRRPRLAALSPEDVCGGRVRDRQAADACLAALWLWNGFLDESHALSQRLPSAEGSWWHGIMHRREGDFGNAVYWFRSLGSHPILPTIGRCVARLVPIGGATGEAGFLGSGEPWNPCRFTELCEAIASEAAAVGDDRRPGLSTIEPLARRIAAAEWRMLFAECLTLAGGRTDEHESRST